MKLYRTLRACSTLALLMAFSTAAPATDEFPADDAILRALIDELGRSMTLQLEDLSRPYFIQYSVEDTINQRMSASYGALIGSDRDHSRTLYSNIRVGTHDLDNTNYRGGGGGFGGRRRGRGGGGRGGGAGGTALPLDDDYTALRQAIWRASDRHYKGAVETLTQKQAYMEDKDLKDRPSDFTMSEPVKVYEPRETLKLERAAWEQRIRRISARFLEHPHVQDSSVDLIASDGRSYLVNSEGSRLIYGDTGVLLRISAQVQAGDGEKLSDSLEYLVETPAELPPIDEIISDVDDLARGLARAMSCPVLEDYTGPVLFDEIASAQMFEELLARGVAGRVDPVGTQRRRFRGAQSLEKRLGKRILPRSFQVYDDPREMKYGDTHLAGHYRYDDEGVAAERVDVVVDGKLVGMAMSRTPTKKLTGSNGHGRRTGRSATPQAAIGCLYIEARDGLGRPELKKALIEAAEEQGLEYGLRVTSLRGGGTGGAANIQAMIARLRRGADGGLGDPIYVTRVYVADGHEEGVRGCEFGDISIRTLREISAAGKERRVYNLTGGSRAGSSASIIAPAVLFEEIDVARIEQEREKKPILAAPNTRPE